MNVGPEPTVLIVDDSEAVCLTLSMMLERDHFRTQSVQDSAEAIRTITQASFDLVIVDLNLGTESGAELAVRILESQPTLRVVIMSGAVDAEEVLRKFPPLRERPVLFKPFSRDELLGCLRSALDRAA